jgi:pantoate kinase
MVVIPLDVWLATAIGSDSPPVSGTAGIGQVVDSGIVWTVRIGRSIGIDIQTRRVVERRVTGQLLDWLRVDGEQRLG